MRFGLASTETTEPPIPEKSYIYYIYPTGRRGEEDFHWNFNFAISLMANSLN